MQKFMKNFCFAKHPNTVTWLIELMYIPSSLIASMSATLSATESIA